MSDRLEIIRGKEMTTDFESEWSALFARAYQSTVDKGQLLLRKYKLNPSRLCVLHADGKMVGSYAGLELPFAGTTIFLATDTMSDGTRPGASVKLALRLYEQLTTDGVLAVCGYPNDKIRKLRQKRLGWVIDGALHLWVGIPFIWRFYRTAADNDLWRASRPANGFFGPPLPGINLLGRDGLYRHRPGLTVTMASRRPGRFFLRVPSMLVAARTFGYRFLSFDDDLRQQFLSAITRLDLETIDLP